MHLNSFENLRTVVHQDEQEHLIKDLALLLLSALRDWPSDNTHDIAAGIAEFKAYFGYPFTIEAGRLKNIVDAPDWTWRGESGAALAEIIQLAGEHWQGADFDAIVDKILNHYETLLLHVK